MAVRREILYYVYGKSISGNVMLTGSFLLIFFSVSTHKGISNVADQAFSGETVQYIVVKCQSRLRESNTSHSARDELRGGSDSDQLPDRHFHHRKPPPELFQGFSVFRLGV